MPSPETHQLSQIRISTKKQQKAALQQGVQCFEIRPSKSERPKVLRRLQFFHILTSKCAFRHSRVHFSNISTYKSAPKTTVFSHFHFQMCLSPQPRAFFQYKHVQKCSEDYSFFTFSLPNVPFATAACNFSTSELQEVVPDRQFFNIFTAECAFRHSGEQFFEIGTKHVQKCSEDYSFLTFSLPNVLFATAACNFSTSELVPDRQFFNIFTAECAFRHSGEQFFEIGTSKSASKLTCFLHFHFKMCFSPQRRAIFDFSSEQLPPHPPL